MKHQAADALCTLSTAGIDDNELKEEIMFMVVAGIKQQFSMRKYVVTSRTQKKKQLRRIPDEYDAGLSNLPELIFA